MTLFHMSGKGFQTLSRITVTFFPSTLTLADPALFCWLLVSERLIDCLEFLTCPAHTCERNTAVVGLMDGKTANVALWWG